MHIRISFIFLLILGIGFSLNAQSIDRFAGIGSAAGYSGDGGPALAAKISYPFGLACDKTGNIYIADMNNSVIRKVSKAGIISTVAGNGTAGYSGDGGSATAAQLNQPTSVAVDAMDNMYILDYGSSVIRMVNSAGGITTIAGKGTNGYSGDGGPATLAQLNKPISMALDISGNIYVSDKSNNVVRKINSFGIISTIAGNGTAGYSGDNGLATSAQLTISSGLAVDRSGNIYIADNMNAVIRKVNALGIITTFAGNATFGYSGDGGPAISAQFAPASPEGLAIDNSGNIYVCDYENDIIRKINTAGIITTIAGIPSDGGVSGDGGPATSAKLWFPIGITVDSCNNVFISDTYNNMIRKITYSSTAAIDKQPVDTTVCDGASVTFMIHATKASSRQWMVNTGTGWTSLADNSVYSGSLTDKLTVTSASISMNNYHYGCLVSNSCNNSFSNAATLTVNSSVSPTVTITATETNICSGSMVTFTATPVNAGNLPSFQWKKNGINIGSNSKIFADNNLSDGDLISCTVTSNIKCATNTATSNIVEIKVNAVLSASITITPSSTSICENTLATFSAAIINGGSSPVYQWKKNGKNTGSNSNIYADSNMLNGDVVTCVLNYSNCAGPATAGSNFITVTVHKSPSVALDHLTALCSGGSATFSAGSFSSYLWNDGSTESTLSVNSVGTYSVTVTDNNGCKATDTVIIKTLIPTPGNFLQPDFSICADSFAILQPYHGYITYLWNTGATSASLTINKSGLYWLEVTDTNNCKGRDTVSVSAKDCLKGFYMPTAFTPNNDGRNDLFKPIIYANVIKYRLRIFNRFGQQVFQTTDTTKGWDGNFSGAKQDSNTFVWICSYQFEREKEVIKKGTVVLIR